MWLAACTPGGPGARSVSVRRGRAWARPIPSQLPRRRPPRAGPTGRAAGTAGSTTRPARPACGRGCSSSGGRAREAGPVGSPTPSPGPRAPCSSRPGCPPRSSSNADHGLPPSPGGYGLSRCTTPDEVEKTVSEPDRPNLDDVMDTSESAPRYRQEHAGGYARPNDDALQHRAEQERQMVDGDDADPAGADLHSATD